MRPIVWYFIYVLYRVGSCDLMGPQQHPLYYVLILEMCFKAQAITNNETPPIYTPEMSWSTEGLQITLDC